MPTRTTHFHSNYDLDKSVSVFSTNLLLQAYTAANIIFLCVHRGLVHSQVDAGYKEDAARTCLNAINLARKRSPSQLVEVLKIQVPYLHLHAIINNNIYSLQVDVL